MQIMREFKQHKKDIEFELRRSGAAISLSIRSIDADLYQTIGRSILSSLFHVSHSKFINVTK